MSYIGSQLMAKFNDLKWEVTCLTRGMGIEIMSDIFTSFKPDVVIHTAAFVLIDHRPADISSLIESNITFGTNLMEAMSKTGIQRLITTGTYWQYFEDQVDSAVNLYAATKIAFDKIVKYYSAARGLLVTELILFDVYGPYDPRPKLIPTLLKKIKDGLPMSLSPGDQIVDFVHIDDVVEAYVCATLMIVGQSQSEFQTYAVGGNERRTVRDVVKTVEQVTGVQAKIEWGARNYREREVMRPWTKGRSMPGWNPKTSFKAAIKSMYFEIQK